MKSITLLFMENIPLERLRWLSNCLQIIQQNQENNAFEISIFLTGDALYSLYDKRYLQYWEKMPVLSVHADPWELKLLGIPKCLQSGIHDSKNQDPNQNTNQNCTESKISTLTFWEDFISTISSQNPTLLSSTIGFLQLEGPYMTRTSIYALRLLETTLIHTFNADYYAYLDGLHTGHPHQMPSEFENIGQKLETLQSLYQDKNSTFSMLACSRCAKARGYVSTDEFNKLEYVANDQVINNFQMCNLNKIIAQFEQQHPIFSSSSMMFSYPKNSKNDGLNSPPVHVIFITHSPFGSEWSFGGLSFAIACANHSIQTHVIFIEEGVFNITGNTVTTEIDHVFDITEILMATEDLDDLAYYAYLPSINERGLKKHESLKFLSLLSAEKLAFLLDDKNQPGENHKRVLFF